MHRRLFLSAAAAIATLGLAGCKTDQQGEKFIGYWEDDSTPHPTLLHIERNGDSLLFTQSVWDRVAGSGYEDAMLPAQIGESSNVLVVAGRLRVTYIEATDTITAGRKPARRISREKYQAVRVIN